MTNKSRLCTTSKQQGLDYKCYTLMLILTIVPYRTKGTVPTVKCRQNSPYFNQLGHIAHINSGYNSSLKRTKRNNGLNLTVKIK